MRYLNDKIFEDLIDRFKWYPKSFILNIFCRDKESMDVFEKEIDNNNLEFRKNKGATNIRYIGIHKVIDIYLMCDNATSFRGRRSNATIFDSEFPYDVVTEIFYASANIEPRCGIFPFQKATLKKDLEGFYPIKNYEIDLE